ncbi:MAG TPA: PLDc N-terminal domain-containing protein [Nocardioidaceae bacterium]|jgi:hypothetical protein
MARRRWADLSTTQRVALGLLAALQVSLAVSAWTDLARRPAAQVNGDKARWAAAIGVNFVGPLAYFRWGRRQRG